MNWVMHLAQTNNNAAGAAGGLFASLFICVMALIGIALFVLWIWMLVDAIRNQGLSDTEKIVWVLVIVLTGFIGAIIYYFVGKPKNTTTATTTTTPGGPPPAA